MNCSAMSGDSQGHSLQKDASGLSLNTNEDTLYQSVTQ